MTENSLAPAFVRIQYNSTNAPHVMTLPTRAWTPPAGGFTHGSFLDWTDTARDADDMIKDLVNLMAILYPTTDDFASYIIYTQSSPTAPPIFADVGSLAIFGATVTPGNHRATQFTFSFLDAEGAKSKLVLLDVATLDLFTPKATFADLTGSEQNLVTKFTSVAEGWSTRNGLRPSVFRRKTVTLNAKLRRAYHFD